MMILTVFGRRFITAFFFAGIGITFVAWNTIPTSLWISFSYQGTPERGGLVQIPRSDFNAISVDDPFRYIYFVHIKNPGHRTITNFHIRVGRPTKVSHLGSKPPQIAKLVESTIPFHDIKTGGALWLILRRDRADLSTPITICFKDGWFDREIEAFPRDSTTRDSTSPPTSKATPQ